LTLQKNTARDIVEALRIGTVPQTGLHEYAVGLDRHMEVMGDQLDRAKDRRGQFKFVRGEYGAGKTFLTHLLTETALKRKFVVSNLVIGKDTPLHKLDEVYREIVANLRTPRQKTGALKGLLDSWIHRLEERLIQVEGLDENSPRLVERTKEEMEASLGTLAAEHSAFTSVLRTYYGADVSGDHALAQQLVGWLSGEKNVSARAKREAGVKGEIDQTMVFPFIRIIAEISSQAGRNGLVVVLDEVETISRMSMRQQREQGLQNVRQIVDAASEGRLPRCHFVFTGTAGFFDDPRGVPALQPLNDRIKLEDPDEPYPNYNHPQIVLKSFDYKKLIEVGARVREIYEVAYRPLDRSRASDTLIGSFCAS
jgi:adenosylhomocysteinase